MKTLIKFSGRSESITTTFKEVSVTFRLFLKTVLFSSIIAVSLFAGSRESDSLALVAIKKANPKSPLNWDYTKSIDTWHGVTLSNNRVRKLKLRKKSLTSIPTEIENLTNLTSIRFDINSLKSLPAEIGKLTNLMEFDLRNNSLNSLPAEIGNITNLTVLKLKKNSLTSLPAEIGNLTNLTELGLAMNSLKSLPATIGNLTKLTELGLNMNSLKSLPAGIGKLTKLTEFALGNNSLTSLPTEIGDLTNLTGLALSSNSLTSLPASIGKLKNLTALKVDKNSLISLPAEIGNLTKLIVLTLSDNSLTSLPAGIGNLTKLIGLYLGNNSLTSLPPGIGNLTKLMGLELQRNSLTSLPAEMENLANLTRLYANENLLSFSDIEYCKSNIPNLSFGSVHYAPQDSLPTVVSNDSTFLFVLIGGSNNSYLWYKNGLELKGETSDTLKIKKSSLDKDKYNCRAASSVITDLTLWTTSTLTPEDDAVPILSGPFIKSSKSLFSASLQNRSIAITLYKAESISISLVDLRGRYVMQPVSQALSAGFHSISIDPKVAQGFYILNIKGDIQNITQKVLIK